MDEQKTGDTPEEEKTKEVATPAAAPEAEKLDLDTTESKDKEEPKAEVPNEEAKAMEGKKETLQDLDKKLYEKREELRKLDTKPLTEEKPKDETPAVADTSIDDKLKPIQESIKRQRDEYSNLALKEISSDPIYHLINASTTDGQANYETLKKSFQKMYPDGFTTKEGYAEAIKKVYAFEWPSQHAGAVADEARKSGQIDMLTKDSANIGGTSSSQKKGEDKSMSQAQKRSLDIYNKDRPKDKQLTPEQYTKYLSEEEDDTGLDMKPF